MLACRVWLSSSLTVSLRGLLRRVALSEETGREFSLAASRQHSTCCFCWNPSAWEVLHLPRSQCFVLTVPLDQRCDTFSKTLKTYEAFSFGLKLFYCLYLTARFQRPDRNRKVCVLNALMLVFQKDNMILNQCMSACKSLYISMCLFGCTCKSVWMYNVCVLRRL